MAFVPEAQALAMTWQGALRRSASNFGAHGIGGGEFCLIVWGQRLGLNSY